MWTPGVALDPFPCERSVFQIMLQNEKALFKTAIYTIEYVRNGNTNIRTCTGRCIVIQFSLQRLLELGQDRWRRISYIIPLWLISLRNYITHINTCYFIAHWPSFPRSTFESMRSYCGCFLETSDRLLFFLEEFSGEEPSLSKFQVFLAFLRSSEIHEIKTPPIWLLYRICTY